MPVTVRPVDHAPREWQRSNPATSPESLLKGSCSQESSQCKQVIQSSFTKLPTKNIFPSSNGFVRAAYHAYSHHHHLTIRPEDVWLSILTQLSFYVNAHAEELRSFFVAHEGQKELEYQGAGTIHTVDFGLIALWMTKEMEKYVVDPDLRGWVMPNFSTTTDSDKVTAAILMMGAMRYQYFSYKVTLMCGIPSVTLLGEKEDWVEIRRRLEKLPQLGEEPKQFGILLSAVLDNLVRSFDEPTSPEVLAFWSKIVHRSGGSGPRYLSGWITAFCFWKADGRSLYEDPSGPVKTGRLGSKNPGCDLDGTLFHRVDDKHVPNAYASVPVTVDDNGRIYETQMVAGSVGIEVTSSGELLDRTGSSSHAYPLPRRPGPDGRPVPSTVQPDVGESTTGLDSLQPVSGWWMYELVDDGNRKPGEGRDRAPSKPETLAEGDKATQQQNSSLGAQTVNVENKFKEVGDGIATNG